MKPEDIKEWANFIYLLPENRLRDPGSKHQKRIREIQDQVRKLRENPTAEVLYPLMVMTPIDCEDNTEYVGQCRYLQVCIKILVDKIRLNEG